RYSFCSRAMFYPLGRLDLSAAGLEHANALAVGELDAHAVGLASSCIENSHVGLVDRHGLFHDAAGGALHGVRLDMLLHQVDAIDHQVGIILAQRHDALLALVAASQHDDLV